MLDYNIVVAFAVEEAAALKEVQDRLRDVDSSAEDMERSEASGLLVRSPDDAKVVVKKLRGLAFRFPEAFISTMSWTPVDDWVRSDDGSVLGGMRGLAARMGPGSGRSIEMDERWQGALVLRCRELVEAGKGSRSPDVILKVVRAGDYAGLVLARPEELLDVNEVRLAKGLAAIPAVRSRTVGPEPTLK